jgi:DNA modification methylase
MAVADQEVTDRYAIYRGDCIEVAPSLKSASVHVTIYSPPFAELYNYSSSEHDLSNCASYEEFLQHYEYLVAEISRVTIPGRVSCVHCMDLRRPGGKFGVRDFPGDIIRMHERHGFYYQARHIIWKEPLRMAIKTRALGLRHGQLVKDSSKCHAAGADYLLVFRREGENPIPITHSEGLTYYAGSNPIPETLIARYGNGWADQKTNRLSQLIWQRYASSVWMDIRVRRVVEFRDGRDQEDEKHLCPLQRDVIERCLTLYSNPGEVMLTPFMGVGSEVCGAIQYGRRGIGIELKESYYRQAVRNIHRTIEAGTGNGTDLFSASEVAEDDAVEEIEDSTDEE